MLKKVFDFHALTFESSYVPKYGLLVEYNLNGKVIRSWHDPTGKVVSSNTFASIFSHKIYLGSFVDNYVAVVDYY